SPRRSGRGARAARRRRPASAASTSCTSSWWGSRTREAPIRAGPASWPSSSSCSPPSASATAPRRDLTIHRVHAPQAAKRYGPERGVGGVDLERRRGPLCALLGPTGAGKSTLLGILSTLIRPTAGKVEFHGGDTVREPDDTLRREIGVLAHASLCYGELSALENLPFFARLYGRAQ